MSVSNSPSETKSQYDEGAEDHSLTSIASGLWGAITVVVNDTLRLLALEGQLAALSLAKMLALAVGATALLFSAWLLVVAAFALQLVNAGLSWGIVLVIAAVVNLLLCMPMVYWILSLSRNLRFSATRHHLGSSTESFLHEKPDSS